MLLLLLDAGPQCDASCDTDGELHCWGTGPDMCQTRKTLFSHHKSCYIPSLHVRTALHCRCTNGPHKDR